MPDQASVARCVGLIKPGRVGGGRVSRIGRVRSVKPIGSVGRSGQVRSGQQVSRSAGQVGRVGSGWFNSGRAWPGLAWPSVARHQIIKPRRSAPNAHRDAAALDGITRRDAVEQDGADGLRNRHLDVTLACERRNGLRAAHTLATWPRAPRMSASGRFFASSSPTVRLRDRSPVAVRIRSPRR